MHLKKYVIITKLLTHLVIYIIMIRYDNNDVLTGITKKDTVLQSGQALEEKNKRQINHSMS